MNKLTYHDLQFALVRCPRALLAIMKSAPIAKRIFVGGGFLRSVVAGDSINDIDVFVSNKEDALWLARSLAIRKLHFTQRIEHEGTVTIRPLNFEELDKAQIKQVERAVYPTENAYTVTSYKPAVQVIHRWTFAAGDLVAASFDFTCCAAAFWWGGNSWASYCDPRFYCDVAAKRLVYRSPVRNEDAGGSMLRVLKYYQKGYRIPLDSLAKVIARLCVGVDLDKLVVVRRPNSSGETQRVVPEVDFGIVIAGLLREVDPAIDPSHVAHLPAEDAAYQTVVTEEAKDAVNNTEA
jgi:hypothetical protein